MLPPAWQAEFPPPPPMQSTRIFVTPAGTVQLPLPLVNRTELPPNEEVDGEDHVILATVDTTLPIEST